MKSYLLVVLLLVLILPNLFGEIRNGYESDLPKLRMSLENLRNVLITDLNLTKRERRRIEARIKSLMDRMVYSELTMRLLTQFKAIAPEIYNRIDTLKDSKGRIIDVYVKFIPKEKAPFESSGIVSLVPSEMDEDRCVSQYGEGTVSVMILILNNSLQVLSHEFGHLQYVVPNLASYIAYYRRTYGAGYSLDKLGHRCDDPSGDNALEFQKQFRQSFVRYMKSDVRVISPYSLANRTRKDLFRTNDVREFSLAVTGW